MTKTEKRIICDELTTLWRVYYGYEKQFKSGKYKGQEISIAQGMNDTMKQISAIDSLLDLLNLPDIKGKALTDGYNLAKVG